MADTRQTKCPHCNSVFRVSPEQLQAKSGMVRCGACLQVFRADLNMVGASTTPAPTEIPKPSTTPKPKFDPKDESWAKEILEEEGVSHTEPQLNSLSLGKNVRPIDDAAQYGAPHEDDWKETLSTPTGTNNTKISLGESELSEFMSELPTSISPTGTPKPSPAPADPFGHTGTAIDLGMSASADEAWAQEILQELEVEEKKAQDYSMSLASPQKPSTPPKPAAATTGKLQTPSPAPKTAPPVNDFTFGDESALDFLNDEDLQVQASPVGSPVMPATSPLKDIYEPVIITPSAKKMQWEKLILWSTANLLALTALLAQIAYFNADELASHALLRKSINDFCHLTGCQITTATQSGLKLDHLLVRKDPDQGSLLVDTLMHNRSGIPARFPPLRLTLRDSEDKVVGSRRFMPSEYLEGEAKSLREIPPDTPVHVSMVLVDPGKSAVNSSLDVAP